MPRAWAGRVFAAAHGGRARAPEWGANAPGGAAGSARTPAVRRRSCARCRAPGARCRRPWSALRGRGRETPRNSGADGNGLWVWPGGREACDDWQGWGHPPHVCASRASRAQRTDWRPEQCPALPANVSRFISYSQPVGTKPTTCSGRRAGPISARAPAAPARQSTASGLALRATQHSAALGVPSSASVMHGAMHGMRSATRSSLHVARLFCAVLLPILLHLLVVGTEEGPGLAAREGGGVEASRAAAADGKSQQRRAGWPAWIACWQARQCPPLTPCRPRQPPCDAHTPLQLTPGSPTAPHAPGWLTGRW